MDRVRVAAGLCRHPCQPLGAPVADTIANLFDPRSGADIHRCTRHRERADSIVAKHTALARTDGAAGEALVAELEQAQRRVATLDARAAEVAGRLDGLRLAEIDEADLCAALASFDPVWDALLVPERERVLRLLIRSVTYHGGTEQLVLDFHPLGITTLAAEVAAERAG